MGGRDVWHFQGAPSLPSYKPPPPPPPPRAWQREWNRGTCCWVGVEFTSPAPCACRQLCLPTVSASINTLTFVIALITSHTYLHYYIFTITCCPPPPHRMQVACRNFVCVDPCASSSAWLVGSVIVCGLNE